MLNVNFNILDDFLFIYVHCLEHLDPIFLTQSNYQKMLIEISITCIHAFYLAFFLDLPPFPNTLKQV